MYSQEAILKELQPHRLIVMCNSPEEVPAGMREHCTMLTLRGLGLYFETKLKDDMLKVKVRVRASL